MIKDMANKTALLDTQHANMHDIQKKLHAYSWKLERQAGKKGLNWQSDGFGPPYTIVSFLG